MKSMARLRRLLTALFVLGVLAAGTELLLLGHYEDSWQWTPLILLSLGLVLGVWRIFDDRRGPLVVFRAAMACFVLGGLVGVWLHYRGNVEFELEMYPGLGGLALFQEAMTGATPTLAPAAMVHLGLLGWLSTFGRGDRK